MSFYDIENLSLCNYLIMKISLEKNYESKYYYS